TVYLDENGDQQHVWQTSWGASTRLIGALIMTHGDDNGLRLPPKLAPVQVVVVLVRDEEGAGEKAASMAAALRDAGHRVRLDARTTDVASLAEARRAAQDGFARVPWDVVGTEGELELAQSGITVRCLQRADGGLPLSSAEPDLVAYVARAY